MRYWHSGYSLVTDPSNPHSPGYERIPNSPILKNGPHPHEKRALVNDLHKIPNLGSVNYLVRARIAEYRVKGIQHPGYNLVARVESNQGGNEGQEVALHSCNTH